MIWSIVGKRCSDRIFPAFVREGMMRGEEQ
jgi:hypothetical protein